VPCDAVSTTPDVSPLSAIAALRERIAAWQRATNGGPWPDLVSDPPTYVVSDSAGVDIAVARGEYDLERSYDGLDSLRIVLLTTAYRTHWRSVSGPDPIAAAPGDPAAIAVLNLAELQQLGGTGVLAEPTIDRDFAVLALIRSCNPMGRYVDEEEVSCVDDLRYVAAYIADDARWTTPATRAIRAARPVPHARRTPGGAVRPRSPLRFIGKLPHRRIHR